MLKRWNIVWACLWAVLALHAEQVSEQEALQKAQRFLQGKQLSHPSKALRIRGKAEVVQDQSYYVFNVEDDGGFVIVSGDDRTMDILGYSDAGSIRRDSMPDNLRYMLDEYSRQIEYLRHSPSEAVGFHTLQEPAISPLVSTRWDQNVTILCPSNLTGCGATAMAQIMNYHKWPQESCAAIPSYKIGSEGNETILEELPPLKFKWNLMLDDYNDFYGQERRNNPNEHDMAVAELMRYCGQALKTDYFGMHGSSTTATFADEFKKYFDYSPLTRMVGRGSRTRLQWESLIYHEIELRRPVLYVGVSTRIWSTGVGHVVVCDGYDGDGRFHINWGWGGDCNGYFVLSILNSLYPDGAMSNGGYSFYQYAVVGIEPNRGQTGEAELWVNGIQAAAETISRGAATESFAPVDIQANVANRGGALFSGQIALAIYKDGAKVGQDDGQHVEIAAGEGKALRMNLSVANGIPNGDYMLRAVFKADDGDDWEEVFGTPMLSVSVSDTQLRFAQHGTALDLRVNSVDIDGPLIRGRDIMAVVNFTNVGGVSDAWVEVRLGNFTDLINVVLDPGESTTYRVKLALPNAGEQNLVVRYYGGDTLWCASYMVEEVFPKHLEGSVSINGLVGDDIDSRQLSGAVSIRNVGQYDYDDELRLELLSLRELSTREYVTHIQVPSDGTMEVPFDFGELKVGEYRLSVQYYSVDDYGNRQVCEISSQQFILRGPLLVITACNASRQYGDANPEFEFTAEGDSLDGEPDIICHADETSSVGDYAIIVKRGSVKNENVKFVNGTLTISNAPLTITAKSYSIKQGDPLPVFDAEYSGFKNGESYEYIDNQPSFSCDATSDSKPGTYEIVVYDACADNYDIHYVNGTLVITEADPITLSALSYTREYGDNNPYFRYKVEGAELFGTPRIICDATADSPVGEYPIYITKGSVRNYNDTYVNGTLTITKAPLTVSVGNYEREEGEENPEFFLQYSGWKLDEDESVLDAEPIAQTEATKESPVGEYLITIDGGAAVNYSFEYVYGSLIVTVGSIVETIRRANPASCDIYDLLGRKIDLSKLPNGNLPKGIYVVNGKKVLVR